MLGNLSLKHIVFVVLILALGLTSFGFAAQDDEFYVRVHSTIGDTSQLSLRTASMGKAKVALPDGYNSVSQNPAGLAATVNKSVGGSLGLDWLDDGVDNVTRQVYVAGGAVSLEQWLPSGSTNQTLGIMYKGSSFTDAAGVGMEQGQDALIFAYGYQVSEDLLAGASIALFSGDWKAESSARPYDRKYNGGEFKLGGLYKLEDGVVLGGSLSYSVAAYKNRDSFNNANNISPASSGTLRKWKAEVGASWQVMEGTLLSGELSYDWLRTNLPNAIDERQKTLMLAAGVEHELLPELLTLRGGSYYNAGKYTASGKILQTKRKSISNNYLGFTAGLGVKLNDFDFGYALDVNTKGDIKNLFNFSAEW